jgi:diaminohydroxyphosphoribosylaminopyrimidine deaminase/5-amino-6-(5-phosphoribosylamino)uracil reductase
VETGLLEQEARRLNRAYLKATQLGLPWVTLKMAMTLDGRIATPTGDSRWVTGEPARRYVHRLRDRNDAVVIGAGTALADDPLLTARIPRSRNPMRVVVDTHLRMGDSSRLAQSTADAPLLVATTVPTGGEALQARGVRVERFRNRDGRVDLEELLRRLTTLGVHSVLCEGGPTLAGTLLDLRLVDEVVWFVAPRLLGSGKAALEAGARERMSEAWELHGLRVRRFGEDVALFGYLHQPWLP